MDYLLVSLGVFLGVGVGAVTLGNVIHRLRERVFSLELEVEKYRNQRDLWRNVAKLPDELENRPPLTPEELERRRDVVDDVIDAHDL